MILNVIKDKTHLTKNLIGFAFFSIILGTLYSASEKEDKPVPVSGNYQKATFAGGCFWCMQPPFDELKGVISTSVGYINGHVEDPTYKQVCAGTTGHTEAIEILFDPKVITYKKLLDVFWRYIDPTTLNKQFYDVGTQYRTGIYYHDENQRQIAETSKKNLQKSNRFKKDIVTEIKLASTFFHAEDYHQQYYKKSPLSYYSYRYGSGRDKYLEKIWGKK